MDRTAVAKELVKLAKAMVGTPSWDNHKLEIIVDAKISQLQSVLRVLKKEPERNPDSYTKMILDVDEAIRVLVNEVLYGNR